MCPRSESEKKKYLRNAHRYAAHNAGKRKKTLSTLSRRPGEDREVALISHSEKEEGIISSIVTIKGQLSNSP